MNDTIKAASSTIAQQIADMFGNDGQQFWTEPHQQGENLFDVCEARCARHFEHSDSTRFEFDDESSIVISGGSAWDFGFPGYWEEECFCWAEMGHSDGCHHAE